MNDNYLNYNKLTFFFNKLKALFATKEDIEDLKGEDGVSITSVEQTTSSASDDGINIITVTLSDGTQSTFNIKNGSKGSGTRGSMIYWGTAITGTSTTATVFSASGVSSALANDLYINTSTWNIYQCTTAGAASIAKWAYKGNIKGATGAAGANATTTAVATTSANGLMSKEMVQKLGAIDGITSDINSESNSIAASSKMVHDLNSNLSELSGGLSNLITVLRVDFTGINISAGGYKQVSLNYTIPNGYKAICVTNYYLSGSAFLNMIAYTTTTVIISNTSTYTAVANGYINLLLVKA